MPLTTRLSPQAIPTEGTPPVEPFRALIFNPWVLLIVLASMISGGMFLATQPHPVLTGDAEVYFKLARWLITGDGLPVPVAGVTYNVMRAPVYIGFLSGLIFFFRGLETESLLQVLRFVQLGLYGLNVWLVYANARTLARHSGIALLAATLFALYLPFVFQTERLLTETLGMTLLLGSVLFWQRDRIGLAGALLLLGLGTNFFSIWGKVLPLGLVAFFALLACEGSARRYRLMQTVAVLFGIAVLSRVVIHWLGLGDELNRLQAEFLLPNFTANDGWAPLVNAAGNLDYLNQRHQPLPPGWQWLPAGMGHFIYWVAQHPQIFAERFMVNLYRYFAHPDNIYGQQWLAISPAVLKIYHQWILFAACLSVPLMWRNHRLSLFLVFPVCWALGYALVHIESRYNLSIMPFVIVAAAFGLGQLVQLGLLRWRHLLNVGVPLVALTLWLNGTFYPILLSGFEGLPYMLYAILGVALLAIWLFALLIPIFRAVAPKKRVSPEFITLLLVAAVSLPMLTAQALIPAVHEWAVNVSGKTHIRRGIPLDNAFFRPRQFRTFLVMETDTPFAEVKIRINGIAVPDRSDVPPGLMLQKHLHGGLIRPDALRQYRFIPLPDVVVDAMEHQYYADISLTSKPDAPPLKLYGDYPVTPGGADYTLPNPDWQHYSIYKTLYDGDGRPPVILGNISEKTGEASESLFAYGRKPLGDADLSPESGLQSGQYRIFLLRLNPEDIIGDYPAPRFRVSVDGNIFKQYRLAY